jgi:transposase
MILPVALRQKIIDKEVLDYINQLQANVIELQGYQNKYLVLKEQYALLMFKRFGRSAEQLQVDEKQQLLFTEEAGQTAEAEEETQTIKSYSRKKAGRKPLSCKLERRVTEVDINESEKACACGHKMTRIGSETSERLQIIPQQIYVEQKVRFKYACRHCEGVETEGVAPTVKIAPVPPSIIPRSIVSPSLLSTIITYKFERHLPYYRQEKLYEQIGADISRQDMSNWQQQVYQKLTPLFALLKETVKSGPVIQMDETTVQVMGEEDREDTQKSYMWLARGALPGKRYSGMNTIKLAEPIMQRNFWKGTMDFYKPTAMKGMTLRLRISLGLSMSVVSLMQGVSFLKHPK